MKILRHNAPDFATSVAALQRSAQPSPQVEQTVREIIAAIRARGDVALLEYTQKFGGPKLRSNELRVTARPEVDATTRRAVEVAHANVMEFAKKSLRKSW